MKPGSMYYYVVAGVNETGTVGLRAGTAPVTATAPVTTTTTTAAPTELIDINTSVIATTPLTYQLRFPLSQYESRVEAWFYKASASDPTLLDPSTASVQWTATAAPNSPTINYVVPTSTTYPRFVKFRRVRSNFFSSSGQVSWSNPVLIPAATTPTTPSSSGTTGTTTSTPATPTGSVVAAAAVTVAAGATLAATSITAGSGSRWMSLNESVATVDASGTITGRTAGTTQVIAVTPASDGSLRVVAIPVTVP